MAETRYSSGPAPASSGELEAPASPRAGEERSAREESREQYYKENKVITKEDKKRQRVKNEGIPKKDIEKITKPITSKVITVKDNVPVYDKRKGAIEFAEKYKLKGYHRHIIDGKVGYMGGATHAQAMEAIKPKTGIYKKETVIRDFLIDTVNINHNGERRVFTINGDIGSRFELEVDDGNGNYYDFVTESFTTTKKSLSRTLTSRSFEGNIRFPLSVRSTTTFTLKLKGIKDFYGNTKFLKYVKVLNEDETVNVNESIGSDSGIMERQVIQGPAVTVSVSSMAPTLADSGEAFNGVTHSTSTIGLNLGRRNPVRTNFEITVTAGTNQAIKIDRQPRPSDIFITSNHTTTAAATISVINDEDIWSETARSTGRVVNGAVTSGTNVTMDDNVGSYWVVGDRITGNAALNAKTGADAVTVTAINVGSNAKVFTMSEAIAIADDAELTFTEPHYYRWPVTNAIGLYNGMLLDPNNTNIDNNVYIQGYRSYTSIFHSQTDENGNVFSKNVSSLKNNLSGVTLTGKASATAYGRNTTQTGDIILSKKQGKSMESQAIRFFAYGEDLMAKVLKGYQIKFTDLKAEIKTENIITTTINDASATGLASLNDFDVTSKNGIMDDVSIVSGVNITASGGNPTVTTIASSTGKNLTVTPGGHFLQNGQTLTFSGAASIITITGTVEIDNIGDNNFTMYFDVEKFLTCASNA